MNPNLTPVELKRLNDALPNEVDTPLTATDTPFFRQLVSTGRDLLAELLTEVRYEPGEIVVQEGDAGDAMFIIWSGRAAVVKGDLQASTLLGYRKPGGAPRLDHADKNQNRLRSVEDVAGKARCGPGT